MEVYDNKERVIYGLLRKHNLMRLNNFIAPQCFLGRAPADLWRQRAAVNQLYISESALGKRAAITVRDSYFLFNFYPGFVSFIPALSRGHSPSRVLLGEEAAQRQLPSVRFSVSLLSFFSFFPSPLLGTIAAATSGPGERQQQRRPPAAAEAGAPFLMHCLSTPAPPQRPAPFTSTKPA